jgi:hypothetical protein
VADEKPYTPIPEGLKLSNNPPHPAPLVAEARPYTPIPRVLELSPYTPEAKLLPLVAVFVMEKTAPEPTFALPENGSVKPPTSSAAGAHIVPVHFNT